MYETTHIMSDMNSEGHKKLTNIEKVVYKWKKS